MNNRMNTENGQATNRFGTGSPAPATESAASRAREATMGRDNALGTNIPPEESSDEQRTFRRLSRSADDESGGRSRADRGTTRGYSTQSWGEGTSSTFGQRRNSMRDRDDTDPAIARMDNEGRMDYGRDQDRSEGFGFDRRGDDYRTSNRAETNVQSPRFQGQRGNWPEQQDDGSRRAYSKVGFPQGDRYRALDFEHNRDRSWEGRSTWNDDERFHADDHRQEGQSRGRSQERKWWQTEAPTVTDVMTRDVKTVDPEAGVRTVAQLMRQEDVGVIPVVRSDGRLYGLITDRDLVVRGLAGDKPVDQCVAKDLATKDLEVASTHDPLSDVIDLMGRQQIRRVPVLDDNDRLVGIISLGDIANRADNDEELQKAFERISGRRSFWSRIWR